MKRLARLSCLTLTLPAVCAFSLVVIRKCRRMASAVLLAFMTIFATSEGAAADIWATGLVGPLAKFGPGGGNALVLTFGFGQPAFDSSGNLHVFRNDTLQALSQTGAELGAFQLDDFYGMLAIDASGSYFVTGDPFTNARSSIRKYSPTGADLGVFATAPVLGGVGNSFGFLAFDSAGNLYATSTHVGFDGYETYIQKYDPTGASMGAFVNLNEITPMGMAIDAADNVYISESRFNEELFSFGTVHKFSSSGTDLGTFASSTTPGDFYGLAFDQSGNLFVATDYSGIQVYDPTGADLGFLPTTYEGVFGFGPRHLAIATVPEVSTLALAAVGAFALVAIRKCRRVASAVLLAFMTLFFADDTRAAPQIFVTNESPRSFSGDLGATLLSSFPGAFAEPVFDSKGNAFVFNGGGGDTGYIRKFGPAGAVLDTFVVPPAYAIARLAVDTSDNLYYVTPTQAEINRVDPTGTDLGAFAAVPMLSEFNFFGGFLGSSIVFDPSGNLYVPSDHVDEDAEGEHWTSNISKFDPSGLYLGAF